MGQAKQRGTFEQRQAEAIAKHEVERIAYEQRQKISSERSGKSNLRVAKMLATSMMATVVSGNDYVTPEQIKKLAGY